MAALAAEAAASATLIGGTAQADELSNQGGPPGEGGSTTVYTGRHNPGGEHGYPR
jgi:hypothetical protein